MTNTITILSRSLAMAVCVLSLSACAGVDSRTAVDTAGGAVVGAGVGALVSVTAAGCIPCGAAVGAVVGAGAGLAYDQASKPRY